jgi:hypothetical protein
MFNAPMEFPTVADPNLGRKVVISSWISGVDCRLSVTIVNLNLPRFPERDGRCHTKDTAQLIPNLPAANSSVQYSTDVLNWLPIGPALLNYSFTDTNAPNGTQRLYRIIY